MTSIKLFYFAILANLWFAVALASPLFFGLNNQSEGGGVAPPVGSLFEDFENAPVGWTADTSGGGTIDYNDDANPLSGSYSLSIQPSSVETYDSVATPDFTAKSTIEVSLEYDTVAAANFDVKFVGLYDASDNEVAYAALMTNGRYKLGQGTTAISSNDVYDEDTKTYIWIEYTKGTGSNGVAKLYWSDTSTKPGSAGLSISDGTGTAEITYVKLMNRNRGLWTAYFDNVTIDE